MKVKYYGTRGSIPTPGKDTIIYGGNTPCVKVETETTLIILDCGTGLKKLGDELMSTEFSKGKGEVHIFISHFHWDHIQGVPFFAPAYLAGNSIFFYGGKNVNQTIEEVLIKQQEYINFPVELGELPAIIRFIELTDGQEINIKDVNIKARKLNHPGGVFGFRIENKGKVLVYATDTEHFSVLDWRLLDLAKGADILIYDSAFSPEEYEKVTDRIMDILKDNQEQQRLRKNSAAYFDNHAAPIKVGEYILSQLKQL